MNEHSRVHFAKKNAAFALTGNILNTLLSFVNRSVFIYFLSVTLLGVNALYTNLLSVLAISELGISAAMDYALYKPVAENDTSKIASLMCFYKKAYRVIAGVVAVSGLILLPFLQYLIKDYSEIGISLLNLRIYYIIFLFNMVSTYFVSYKYSLVKAHQKDYIIYGFEILGKLAISVVQIIVLFLFKNFLLYLLVQSFVGLIVKAATAVYINRRMPICMTDIVALDKNVTAEIKNNVVALIFIRFGTISITQTQSIIISAFLSVVLVGYISNYNLIIGGISAFAGSILNSVISSIGNYMATESKEKQLQVFELYSFLGFWIHGFINICFFVIIQPFITVWIGGDKLISIGSVLLILINQYLAGQRCIITSFRNAAGTFTNDKIPSVAQAIVNLGASLVLVQIWGLNGIFIGAIVAELVSMIIRPAIIYKTLFRMRATKYYMAQMGRFVLIAVCAFVLYMLFLLFEISYLSVALMCFIAVVFINGVFFIVYRNNASFRFLADRLGINMKKGRKRDEREA